MIRATSPSRPSASDAPPAAQKVSKIAPTDKVTVRKVDPFSQDQRGSVVELGGEQTIGRLILVISKKGSVRGNHYHLRSGHFVYVVEGKIRLTVRALGKVRMYKLAPGSVAWIPPQVEHVFYSLTDSKALEYAHDAYSSDDAFPLKEPLPGK